MLPGGLFDSLYAQDELKKLLAGDGVEIVVLTILTWVLLFVLYILGFAFRLS
jgi:hypothetical protein